VIALTSTTFRLGKSALDEYDQYAVYLAILNHGAICKLGGLGVSGEAYATENLSGMSCFVLRVMYLLS